MVFLLVKLDFEKSVRRIQNVMIELMPLLQWNRILYYFFPKLKLLERY